MSLTTPLTTLFKIRSPIMLAGMNVSSGPELAAAVTNAGGIGSIGGVGYTPEYLREQIHELKSLLDDPNAPFGIDLLLPQVGGNARKTNKDYTGGKLNELIDIIIEEKAALFISAVGVPPREVVEKLHKAGIPVANMVGAVKHVLKACNQGVDIIIAQGTEGGGHTGEVPTSLLVPACVAAVKGKISPLTGKPVMVVAAGGIYNGAGLAAALAWGSAGVWVGTRFVCSEESGSSRKHQEAVLAAKANETIRSLIFTGRPLRVRKTPYIMDWENNRLAEMKTILASGKLPHNAEDGDPANAPFLMGITSSEINDILPAKVIVESMVAEAVAIIKNNAQYVSARL